MKGLVLLFTSLLWLGAISQTSEEVILVSDSIEIHGTVLVPEEQEQIPVVLIIAGSGPTDRDGNNQGYDNNSLKMLAEALADSGIASLRYDKRGVAESDAQNVRESDMRFEDFSSDAEKWIELLAKDKRFNKITVLGHSEGSLIGMLASKTSAVDKFISAAGPGRAANVILLEQINKNSPFFTVPASIMLDSLANGYTVSSILPALQGMFRPSIQPYIISWFQYDPAVEIAKLDIPVLIVQGTTDIQVPVSDAELLADANPRAKLVIIEGMNHVFKEAPAEKGSNLKTYSDPDLPLIKGFAQEIIEFILN